MEPLTRALAQALLLCCTLWCGCQIDLLNAPCPCGPGWSCCDGTCIQGPARCVNDGGLDGGGLDGGGLDGGGDSGGDSDGGDGGGGDTAAGDAAAGDGDGGAHDVRDDGSADLEDGAASDAAVGDVCTLWVDPAPVSASLELDSEAGDFIGQGQTYSYTAQSADFTMTPNYQDLHKGIRVYVETQTGYWNLSFAAPHAQLLRQGSYLDATKFPSQAADEPGLHVSGNGRGCNTLQGSFVVVAVEYLDDQEVVSFSAEFEQHCEGKPAALTGTVTVVLAVRDTCNPGG
jgi:hypothetical protein